MADKPDLGGLELEASDPRLQALWEALADIEQPHPPARLRRSFYDRLASTPAAAERGAWRLLRRWLRNPLLPAAAMLVVGILIGRLLQVPVANGDLDTLKQQVAALQRDVALGLLGNASAAERLDGVMRAADFSAADPQVATALLRQAASDPSQAVRAAAIDALAPRLQAPGVAEEVLRLLGDSASPLVQRALVNLILRHGSPEQLEVLLDLAQRGELHPELDAYVSRSVRRAGA